MDKDTKSSTETWKKVGAAIPGAADNTSSSAARTREATLFKRHNNRLMQSTTQ